MPTPVSLLVVNYRSSGLAVAAIRSARAATQNPLQVIVVDNSVHPAEPERLRNDADVVIASDRNMGYAAAINRGRRDCDGEVVVAANPDVIFAANSIDALAEANAAVAGPALFWDDAHEWILPPADLHTSRDILGRAVATRSRALARSRDRRRIRERIDFWSLTETTPVRALSGAVMAIRARAFDDAGGFDERFPLYFEENDFLRRVRGDVVYVPAARVRHLYNQSAGASSEAGALYARSEAEYLRKWGGAFAKRFERAPRVHAAPPFPGLLDTPPGTIVEASPLPSFETAAGHFPRAARTELPAEVWAAYRGGELYLRVVRRDSGEVLARFVKMTA